MKKIAVVLFLFACAVLYAADTYRVSGKITSPDLKNVSICDGEKFYKPNGDGSYNITFSTENAGFIYLELPSHLQAENGRWSVSLKPGDNKADFKLKKIAVPEKFTFIHGSDVQYDFLKKGAELANDMAEIAAIIKEYKAEFITFPGDLTLFGDREQLDILKAQIVKNKMNHYALFGGHDRYRSKPSLRNFADCIGAPYFSWYYGNIFFFAPLSEYTSLPEQPSRTRQVRYIENTLKRLPAGTKVIVVTHQPPLVSEQIEKLAKAGNFKVLAYFGAHTHFHNLYHENGIPVLISSALRAHDTGTFSKQLRLVNVDGEKITTSTRLLNQKQRIEPTLYGGDKLLVRTVDFLKDPESVSAVFRGKTVKLAKLNQFVWGGTLPEKVTSPNGEKIAFTVKYSGGSRQKTINVKNISSIQWCAVLPVMQRDYPKAAIAGDRVFVAVQSGELPAEGGVDAYDIRDGKLLWRFRQKGADIAVPAASDGKTVRAFTVDGVLLTLDAATGKLLRSKQLPMLKHQFNTAVSRVQLAPGKVLLVTNQGVHGGKLFCLDSNTDAMLWKQPLSLGKGALAQCGFSIADDVIYFSGAGCFGAADLNTGRDIWRRVEKIRSSPGEPLVCADGIAFALRGRLLKVDAKTGKTIWEQKPGFPGSTRTTGGLVLSGDKLISTSTNALISTEWATGKRLYRYNLQPQKSADGSLYNVLANTAKPAILNGRVSILGNDGTVYELDPAKIPPKELFRTGFAFKGHPEIAGNNICAVGFDGVIYFCR